VFGPELNVLSSHNSKEITPISEDSPLPPLWKMSRMRSTLAGYPQSKWAAEQLVQEAIKRGIPVTIYRPAQVLAHSRTGAVNPFDLVARMYRSTAQLGCYGDDGPPLRCITVDRCAEGIASLSCANLVGNSIFHLVFTKQMLGTEVLRRAFGSAIHHGMRLNEWLGVAKKDPNNALTDYLPMMELGRDPSGATTVPFANEKTMRTRGCPDLSGKDLLDSTATNALLRMLLRINTDELQQAHPKDTGLIATLTAENSMLKYVLGDSKTVDPAHPVHKIAKRHAEPVRSVDLSSETAVCIIGAGFSGLVCATQIRETAGVDVDQIRLIERYGGVGGTWFANTYPGCMSDV
jgi:hypothetical protein